MGVVVQDRTVSRPFELSARAFAHHELDFDALRRGRRVADLVALVGTGLATVALGLLAWELVGGDAGPVLGMALAIKMVTYVTLWAMLAAALLTVVSFPVLFGGTVIGFVASAVLVLSVTLPWPKPVEERDVWTRITCGTRIYLATPRLRALFALSFSVAAAGARVIV